MKNLLDILIITTSGDSSTNTVIDWITKFGYNPIRFNTDVGINNDNFKISHVFGSNNNETCIKINNINCNSNNLKSIWFRKFDVPNLTENLKEKKEVGNIVKHLNQEYFSAMYSFFDSWQTKKTYLGGKITKQPSKMDMLIAAKENGIDIPDTLITNNKTKLKLFLNKHNKVITKSIRSGKLLYKKDKTSKMMGAFMFTELLDNDIIAKIPDYFFYSLFQEALKKDFEIRTFYLDGECYSMAIFSQLDKQTDIDFRMYNNERGNRNTPYKLPKRIETKIKKLMKLLGLITGSLDFIKTIDNRFVFLEVNPWGQYGMVSEPCNYYIDKKIAEYLTK